MKGVHGRGKKGGRWKDKRIGNMREKGVMEVDERTKIEGRVNG